MSNQYVAYRDERHGLGAWVAEQIAADLFRNPADREKLGFQSGPAGAPTPEGRPVSSADLSLSLSASGSRRSFGGSADAAAPAASAAAPPAYRTWTSPRASAEQTAAAVISGQAQIGVLPLFEEGTGFDQETLAALIDFPQDVLGEYVAESNYVLAVPTDLLHEIDQAGFSDSFDAQGTRGFKWTADKQRKFKGRLGTVYASSDAMKHCAAAIAGLQAKGIDVQLLPDGTDTYREGIRLAHAMLDPDREVAVTHSAHGQSRVSKIKAGNHAKPLIGVLLSFDKALGDGGYSFDSDYQMLDAELAGADRVRTSFLATARMPRAADGGPAYSGSDMDAVTRYFKAPRRRLASADEGGPLRPVPGLGGKADAAPAAGGPFPYARLLYAVPTAGPRAKDHSEVLRRLAEARLSYRTQPLDNRDGMPVVIAIDIPQGGQAKLRPVLRALHKLPGAARIAAFPSVTPMVAEDMRARPAASPAWRLLFQGLGVIGLGIAGFAALSALGVF